MAYNFMSLFRHALINSDKKPFLKTIRYELISIPAHLAKTSWPAIWWRHKAENEPFLSAYRKGTAFFA